MAISWTTVAQNGGGGASDARNVGAPPRSGDPSTAAILDDMSPNINDWFRSNSNILALFHSFISFDLIFAFFLPISKRLDPNLV